MHYRVYLLGAEDHIQAGQSFYEASDADAIEAGRLLYSLCDDKFTGYEVWRGPVMLYVGRSSLDQTKETLATVCERRQRLAIEREESLMDSFSCVRSSKKLLRELDVFKVGLASSPR